MTKEITQAGQGLPVPPDFPVVWERNEDSSLLWSWDDIHSPLPSSTLSASISEATIEPGASKAGRELGPQERRLSRLINGYSYSATLPGEETPEQEEVQRRLMDEAVANTRYRWDTEFLPKLERDLTYMRSLDIGSSDNAQLLQYLDEFFEIQRDHWHIHFLVVFPVSVATEHMATLYREIVGDVPDEEPYLLLQGIDNKSLEVDRSLRDPAIAARHSKQVARVFAEETSPEAITSCLSLSSQGTAFLSKVDGFLSIYGYRSTGFDLVYPSWKEDPSFVMLTIKSYLSRPPRDLDVEARSGADESERLLDGVLEKLGGDESNRARFLDSYRRARELWPLKEDHTFYIDQGSSASLRLLLAEIGKRLTQLRAIEEPDDVFHMKLDELKAAMRGAVSGDLTTKITARRRERDHFSKIIPPPFLGTMPPEKDTEQGSVFHRMFGPKAGPRPEDGSKVLRGVVGSGGGATGTAKVVRSPDEFDKIRPGDILVCTSTSPTWTALFASVGAVVSDSGGVLSHTAIVAREYRLPAVVGVKYGTSTIPDGQVITVDGDAGVVYIG